jgi:hypothetical protein
MKTSRKESGEAPSKVMENSGNAKGLNIDHQTVIGWKVVNNRLAVKPGSHDVVEAIHWKIFLSKGDRGIDQRGVWDGDTCNEAGHMVKYLDHLGASSEEDCRVIGATADMERTGHAPGFIYAFPGSLPRELQGEPQMQSEIVSTHE